MPHRAAGVSRNRPLSPMYVELAKPYTLRRRAMKLHIFWHMNAPCNEPTNIAGVFHRELISFFDDGFTHTAHMAMPI